MSSGDRSLIFFPNFNLRVSSTTFSTCMRVSPYNGGRVHDLEHQDFLIERYDHSTYNLVAQFDHSSKADVPTNIILSSHQSKLSSAPTIMPIR